MKDDTKQLLCEYMRKPNPYMFSIRQCTFGMKTVERIKQSLLILIAMADLWNIIPKCDYVSIDDYDHLYEVFYLSVDQ